jgi:hypothetical protein
MEARKGEEPATTRQLDAQCDGRLRDAGTCPAAPRSVRSAPILKRGPATLPFEALARSMILRYDYRIRV